MTTFLANLPEDVEVKAMAEYRDMLLVIAKDGRMFAVSANGEVDEVVDPGESSEIKAAMRTG